MGEGSRGSPVRQCLDDVHEWTGLSLNEIWREPEDSMVWRTCVSRVAPIGLKIQDVSSAYYPKQNCRHAFSGVSRVGPKGGFQVANLSGW